MDQTFQRQRPETHSKHYRPQTGPAVILYDWIRDPARSSSELRLRGVGRIRRPLVCRHYWHQLCHYCIRPVKSSLWPGSLCLCFTGVIFDTKTTYKQLPYLSHTLTHKHLNQFSFTAKLLWLNIDGVKRKSLYKEQEYCNINEKKKQSYLPFSNSLAGKIFLLENNTFDTGEVDVGRRAIQDVPPGELNPHM